jgi:thiol-disulfide isomerase/thioredoxin
MWLLALVVILSGSSAFLSDMRSSSFAKEMALMQEYEGKVNAPEFPADMEWLNTERPLSIRELRGKIILLDFWTYCCINCIHVIPDLKRLEEKYAKELVVIGVHSAKFKEEKETENIRQAILRYEIEHPVVNDAAMEIWQEYGVRAWPTLILITPTGKVLGSVSGEGIYDRFDKVIGKLIEEFDAKKQIDRRPLGLKLERHRTPSSMLAFPGKVLADEKSRKLFIADSNHNRIVVASLDDYSISEVIGTGQIGLKDGDFETATFHHPQGMTLDGQILYVADTENHAIRSIDLQKRSVVTIAGTGEQARRLDQLGGQGKETQLNSPWDLVIHDGMLYIAMAGPHQLWRMNPKTGGITPYAGSGRENITDGPLYEAALAQPSGITHDGKKLYFADSEVSAIRSADLDINGAVETIVGQGLFEFGDRDGKGAEVRLQHPLGVVYHEGVLFVADTYNNKIKRISPKDKSSQTFLGTGQGGLKDGDRAQFDEPGGVSVANGKIFVADTNNHAIRVADLKSKRVETIQFKGIEKLRPRAKVARFAGETIDLTEQTIEPGDATLTIQLELPTGFKLNAQAPSAITINAAGVEQTIKNPQFPLSVPIKVPIGEAIIRADYVIYYCEAGKESLCYFKEARLSLPLKGKAGAGSKTLTLNYKLTQGF